MRSSFSEGSLNIDILSSCPVDKIEHFRHIQGIVHCFGELKVHLLKSLTWRNLNMHKLTLTIFFSVFFEGMSAFTALQTKSQVILDWLPQ